MTPHPAQIVLALRILSKDATSPTGQLSLDRVSRTLGLGAIDWNAE